MTWNKIHLKLSFTIFSLFIGILILLSIVLNLIFTNFLSSKVHDEANELAAHLSSMLEEQGNSAEQMADFTGVQMYILSSKGTFIESKASGIPTLPEYIWENDKLLEGQKVEKEFTFNNKLYLLHGIPVTTIPTVKGIYVISSLENMKESIQTIRNLLFIAGIGSLLLAMGCIFFLSKRLSNPLLKIEKATRQIAKGELNLKIPVETKDEIGSLSQAINDLARELKQYRDNRSEFFANVSHELRTPITYLEGYADILAKDLVENEEEKKKYLQIISEEAQRLNVIINDLFELSKMEEGKIDLKLMSVEPNSIIQRSIDKVQLKAQEKDLTIQSKLSSVPHIFVDPNRLEQIILNLLDNAIRYTAEGNIQVSLTSEVGGVAINISDSGPGISAEELPFIFERFYRVEKSRSREYGGTGLGLSIVQSLVLQQGGTINVESKIGVGTSFKIIFPPITSSLKPHSSKL
ncbi:sensor histidine kinase [Paenibacillus illinoisensis]|uniref:sensor histidine kinase n=1 Tax=Paenibacillus illinoisensis TaxID=59845 RepID=UPI00301E4BC7